MGKGELCSYHEWLEHGSLHLDVPVLPSNRRQMAMPNMQSQPSLMVSQAGTPSIGPSGLGLASFNVSEAWTAWRA